MSAAIALARNLRHDLLALRRFGANAQASGMIRHIRFFG